MTRSLDRGLTIVETLVQSDRPYGVSDLARLLKIDKATVHRLLKVLSAHEFVQQDPATRRYRCTPRIIELSAHLLGHLDLPQRARPYLHALVNGTGLSAHLVILARSTLQWAVYIADEKSASHIQVDVRVGQMAPTHCTAVGKALIADVPEATLRTMMPTGALRQYTPRTITYLTSLVSHLAQVRERGYAVDDEEFHLNIRCIGAPVRDSNGKVAASLGVSGVTTELPKQAIPHKAAIVMELAEELSRAIGFPGIGRGVGRKYAALASSDR